MYYLNHVGYKDQRCLRENKRTYLYYLNHVGYKVVRIVNKRAFFCLYYLNHVGYKANYFFKSEITATPVLSEPCGI